jgi:DNA-binding MarR family transcriptional regulator
VQKLAAVAWDFTDDVCDGALVKTAYEAILANESAGFEGILGGLSIVQKAVLKALAREPTRSPYARKYLAFREVAASSAQKAMRNLIDRDLVEKDRDGIFRPTDPVLVDWLIRNA